MRASEPEVSIATRYGCLPIARWKARTLEVVSLGLMLTHRTSARAPNRRLSVPSALDDGMHDSHVAVVKNTAPGLPDGTRTDAPSIAAIAKPGTRCPCCPDPRCAPPTARAPVELEDVERFDATATRTTIATNVAAPATHQRTWPRQPSRRDEAISDLPSGFIHSTPIEDSFYRAVKQTSTRL